MHKTSRRTSSIRTDYSTFTLKTRYLLERSKVVPPAPPVAPPPEIKPPTQTSSATIKKKSKKKERKKRNLHLPDPDWDCLPDIVLEDIFSRLSIRDRYNASQVCRNWNRIFYSPGVWSTFVLGDFTLTRRKYDFYFGYQHLLDHHRTQMCLQRVGRNFRNIVIKPMENFRNLYGFLTVTSFFCECLEYRPLTLVKSLDFTFGCEIKNSQNDNVFGTGGQLLAAFKRLMTNLPGLKDLSLQDLLLEKEEAMYLLDDVAYNCCETLRTLRLINCSKEPYDMFHAGVFINLRKLTISPQHISDEVIRLIGFTKIKDLYLLQTKHTENVTPVSVRAWKECRKNSPYLNVHLKIEGKLHTEIFWQEGAPVRSIIYSTPYAKVSVANTAVVTNLYENDLRAYVYLGLPRFYMSRKFDARADSSLCYLCRNCPNLDTLVIRELVSTATLILLAYEFKNLKKLVVRKNAILKRCDWPYNPSWTIDFYCGLMHKSKSYEETNAEVSRLLGSKWTPLTDREFKKFKM